jgi:hypothetical protein
MRKTTKISGLLTIVGLLMLGAILVPAVSAKDLGTIGSDLPVLLSGHQNLSSIEFVVVTEQGAQAKFWQDAKHSPEPIKDLQINLNNVISNLSRKDDPIANIIISIDDGQNRISYSWDIMTGHFKQLNNAIPDIRTTLLTQNNGLTSFTAIRPLVNIPPTDTVGHTINGRSVYSWARSVSNPSGTIMGFMTATDYVKRWDSSSSSWTDWVVASVTNYGQTSVFASDTSTYIVGSYHQYGAYSGTYRDGTSYNDPYKEGGYFSIT